eukprot:2435608-Pleurochrysis_carterae.AAC.1
MYKLGKHGQVGAVQAFSYLCALREPEARGKGALPCAWLHLFGSCEKRSTGACDSCRVADAAPAAQRAAAPADMVAR